MYLNGHISVTINGKLLKTIISVEADHDGHCVGGECKLKVPLISTVQYKDGVHDYLTQYTDSVTTFFKVGDHVEVVCWYDNYPKITVFKGFVFDFIEGQPMTIRCLDYSYWFNLGIFGSKTVPANYKSITFKNLIENIIAFVNNTISTTDNTISKISLITPTFDMTLVNITFAMMTPLAVLDWLRKEMGFNITLIGNKLYANIASYTDGLIDYDTTVNVTHSDIQKPGAVFQTFKVKCWFMKENGTKDSIEVGDSNGQLKEFYFYTIKQRNETLYKKLAAECLNKAKQKAFSGSITTPLYTQPILFAKVVYKDKRFPNKNGNYVITGYTLSIGDGGYRYKVKLSNLSL